MEYHVADFIIRIKNAARARRSEVKMPYSNINLQIGKVLVKEGFLASITLETIEGKKQLKAMLRLVQRKTVIGGVAIVSKPSLRVYTGMKMLGKSQNRSMTTILSTSQGIMTGKEAAKKGVGGELLFQIW